MEETRLKLIRFEEPLARRLSSMAPPVGPAANDEMMLLRALLGLVLFVIILGEVARLLLALVMVAELSENSPLGLWTRCLMSV